MKFIGSITTGLIVIAFSILFNGWIFYKLWSWIITPIFQTDPLTIIQSIGILIIISYILHKVSTKKSKSKSKEWSDVFAALLNTVLTGLFSLFMAWIVTLFM